MKTTELINVKVNDEFYHNNKRYIVTNHLQVEVVCYNFTDNCTEYLPRYIKVNVK